MTTPTAPLLSQTTGTPAEMETRIVAGRTLMESVVAVDLREACGSMTKVERSLQKIYADGVIETCPW